MCAKILVELVKLKLYILKPNKSAKCVGTTVALIKETTALPKIPHAILANR